jgi:hypothetical protein
VVLGLVRCLGLLGTRAEGVARVEGCAGGEEGSSSSVSSGALKLLKLQLDVVEY